MKITKTKVVSKAQADRIARQHPDSIRTRYNGEQYPWTGKSSDYIGREVPATENIHAVYVERRQDALETFAVLMCVANP